MDYRALESFLSEIFEKAKIAKHGLGDDLEGGFPQPPPEEQPAMDDMDDEDAGVQEGSEAGAEQRRPALSDISEGGASASAGAMSQPEIAEASAMTNAQNQYDDAQETPMTYEELLRAEVFGNRGDAGNADSGNSETVPEYLRQIDEGSSIEKYEQQQRMEEVYSKRGPWQDSRPPQGPNGFDLDRHLEEMEAIGKRIESRSAGLPWPNNSAISLFNKARFIYSSFRNKAQFDFKQQGRQYEAFGNYAFGVSMEALGIPLDTATRGAGFAQKLAGTSLKGWGHPLDNWTDLGATLLGITTPPATDTTYGDDPDDFDNIVRGYGHRSRRAKK